MKFSRSIRKITLKFSIFEKCSRILKWPKTFQGVTSDLLFHIDFIKSFNFKPVPEIYPEIKICRVVNMGVFDYKFA